MSVWGCGVLRSSRPQSGLRTESDIMRLPAASPHTAASHALIIKPQLTRQQKLRMRCSQNLAGRLLGSSL